MRTSAAITCLPRPAATLFIILLHASLSSSHAQAADATGAQPVLALKYRSTAEVFRVCEMSVAFPADLRSLEQLPDTQIHDAYDADRDGVFIRLSAEFTLDEKHSLTVPGFAMKERPDGPWQWWVRWSPDRPGRWSVRLLLDACPAKSAPTIRLAQTLPDRIEARVVEGISGPLVTPAKGQNPRYVRRALPDGGSIAVWLFGACRAWVAARQDPDNDWSPHEWIDREKELLGPMRDGGFNLLNQWMAPWEFLIIHHDRAEFWQAPDGSWKRVALPKTAAWTSYQCLDQGRALAFDRLVALCEGRPGVPPIHLLLSPLPHQCLQVKEHPWGGQESGWSPENDAGKQTPDRLNGFSGFKKNMNVWAFFDADPRSPISDPRSRLFDHQANFFRYLFARWGASPSIGVWVLVDELDAIGEEVGIMSTKKGWWAHPQCDRWLADVVRLFHGSLDRSDKLRYHGDPYRHPIHAATTSFGGQAEKGGNLEWNGGPPDARPDVFGWHWYPYWPGTASWNDCWKYTVDGVTRYATAPLGDAARLVSEFGAADRDRPDDTPSPLYPGLYHFAIWPAIFAGHAGTPMDWDDGKQFGELRWREREGIFDKEHYPIDHVAQLKALRTFLGDLSPDNLVSTCAPGSVVQCVGAGGVTALALCPAPGRVPLSGWLFSPDMSGKFTVKGLAAAKYVVTWFDPWTGLPVGKVPPSAVTVGADGVATLDAGPVLKVLFSSVPPFPVKGRLPKGYDAAFKIEPAKNKSQ